MKSIRKILLILLILISISLKGQAQQSCSYGSLCTSLSTTSATAVTGTVIPLPPSYGIIISWQVTADGSGLSVNLMGSLDNVTFFQIDTQTTAAGGVKNVGPTAIKFLRIDAVSRTGGTTTTGVLVVGRY